MLGRKVKFLVLLCACFPLLALAQASPTINITENTDPKIAELYQQLQSAKEKIQNINDERVSALDENATAMKEKEQSKENRTLTAATTAATGIGGMELARGLAEQSADKDAEQDITAYLATFRCEYGDGKSVKGNTTEIELPGGNDSEMAKLRAEYFALATDLKQRKTALDMLPGIESEEILDKSQTGLYDDEFVGITNGAEASLYRAQMLDSEQDKAQLEANQKTSKNRVIGGAVAAGAGVVGGIAGDMLINKDAPKERSKEINREYDKQIADATAESDEIEKQLNAAIAENRMAVQKYNNELQQHKDYINNSINKSSENCKPLFNDYVSEISGISPIENETDSVPTNIGFPDLSEKQTLLNKCTACETKGGVFDSKTQKCPCPEDKPVEGADGKCVEISREQAQQSGETEYEPVVENKDATALQSEENTEIKIDTDAFEFSEDEFEDAYWEQSEEYLTITEIEESKRKCVPVYDAKGKLIPNGLSSITAETEVGDFCSSTNIAVGEVVKRKNGSCTCLASSCKSCCYSKGGRCLKIEVQKPNCEQKEYNNVPNLKTGNDALKFCETKGGTECKTINAINNYGSVKGRVLCNANQTELGAAKQRVADSKLKYYNCGESDKIPKGITCKFIQDFKREKVTPMEAMGLMKEYALKKYKDDIKCDEHSHRKSNDYRQCASRKNSKYFYEFEFKNLDAGNSGFTDALCLIWGLKGGMNLCKDANQSQCKEISAAVNRTFYIGGSAELKGTNCLINSHPRAESAPIALLNTKVLTKEDMRTVGNIDPLHFYDKKLQINANSDVYKTITNYLFVEQRLPVKQFSCGAGFVDNTMYYNVSRQKYNETQEKIRKCQQDSQNYSGGGEHAAQGMGGAMLSCNKQYPLDSKSGDLLSCEYDGQPIDFLFQKLDVKWNRKSTAGYQGLRCLSEGGSFTGKSCTLANKEQCDSFNARFKKDYPNSKGMEWDEEMGTCVLKDAKHVSNVQKVAETTGMVALTLVTAVSGGPVVWALSVVEGAALVTEAVTEEKINDWAEAFLVDAAHCKNNSSCANGVMKEHIARIMEGSKQFNETQNKQIAKQTERLLGMLDEKTVSAIVDKGEASGYIGEDRDPDLEKSIRAYYGTQLTSGEKRLLTTKKVATVATFATLIGGGIMAGLRQSFKHNLIYISKAKQARWLDLKLLKVEDVTDDVVAMSKTGQKAAAKAGKATVKMEANQAQDLERMNKRIAELEAKTNKTHEEAQELQQLHQKRNTLLNKVGTKDADELARASDVALNNKAIEDAKSAYNKAIQERDYVAKYMSEHNGNLPKGTDKYRLKQINDDVAKAENKLKELGQEVTPAEPLQIGKKPTVTPAETKPVETKPVETTPKPAESTAKPKETSDGAKVDKSKPTSEPTVLPKETTPKGKSVEEIENSLGDRYKNMKSEVKSNPDRTLVFEKDYLTDEEWGTLNKSLAKENLEVVQSGQVMFVRQKRVFPDAISDIRNRAYSEFNSEVNKIKNGTSRELYVPKAHLSDDEWKLLEADLNKEGLEITEANDHYYAVRKSTKPKTVNVPATTAKNAVNNTDKVAKTAATDIGSVKKKLHSNFDKIMDDIKTGKKQGYVLPKNKKGSLSEEELYLLSEHLKENGLELVDDSAGNLFIRKAGSNVKPVAPATPATKTTKKATSKAEDAAKTSKAAVRKAGTTKFGRWEFNVIINDADNIKYYERAFGDEIDQAKNLSDNILKDFNKNALVFKRDDQYVVAVFDNSSDAAKFRKSNNNIVHISDIDNVTLAVSTPKSVVTPATPKRPLTQEEAEWRALYEKYAPKNQSLDNFKKSFGNDLDKVKEYAKNGWERRGDPEALYNEAGQLWTDFHKKYDADDNSFLYGTYRRLKDESIANGTYKWENGSEKIPGLESWTKEQLEDANKIYAAQTAADIAGESTPYSTFDVNISALKGDLNSADYDAIYKEFSEMAKNEQLTNAEIKELVTYINGGDYNESTVLRVFNEKDNSVLDVTNNAKTKYQEFLKAKSENVQKIDEAAGLHAGVDRATGELIAKNKFVQDFVSKRVSMYEDIITKNPRIYNRAKRWNTLSIEEREKLCKEIFEIADDELGVRHTEFAVRDLVKDFNMKETTSGLQTDGNVYISSRHFPNMSFGDVMDTLAHEQAHKVDKLNPNKGILGSQLEDLGRTEGYIQGYTGHAYADYRKELTEQSSWMIGDATKKAISNLGL